MDIYLDSLVLLLLLFLENVTSIENLKLFPLFFLHIAKLISLSSWFSRIIAYYYTSTASLLFYRNKSVILSYRPFLKQTTNEWGKVTKDDNSLSILQEPMCLSWQINARNKSFRNDGLSVVFQETVFQAGIYTRFLKLEQRKYIHRT